MLLTKPKVPCLTGIEINDEADLVKTADYFRGEGVATTLVTLGSRGAYFNHNGKSGIVPAFKVKAVDTTAAGDTFIGGSGCPTDPV